MRNMNNRCSKCHHNRCDCTPNPVLSREEIHDRHEFCVAVNGDYLIDGDDGVVHVIAPTPATSPPTIPVLTLPASRDVDHECARITIVAQDTAVLVLGLNDAAVNTASAGSRSIAAFTAVTFWLSEGIEDDPCSCDSTGFWVAEGLATIPTP